MATSDAGADDNNEMVNPSLEPAVGARMIELMRAQCTAEKWGEWLCAPLELAVAGGDEKLADQLLRAGATGDPIYMAIGAEQHDVLRHMQLKPNHHHLQSALERGNEAMVSLLLELGADADPEEPSTYDVRDDMWFMPLHFAAKAGQARMVRLLLDAGACADRRANRELDYGQTSYFRFPTSVSALHLGAREGHVDVITEIIQRQPSIVNSVVVSTGYTALHYAAKHSQLDAIDALVEAGADLEACEGGTTALLAAVHSPDCNATLLALLRHGASVHSAQDKSTPLSAAVQAAKVRAIEVLVSAGADVREPLLLASGRRSSEEMIITLLGRGADVNAKRESDGNTPLHLAAERVLTSNVDVLLKAGADATAVNDRGKTPLDVIGIDEIGRDRRESISSPWIDSDEEEDEEANEVRYMMINAPRDRANRAWARRGFFVLCRAFPERVRLQLVPSLDGSVNNDACANASAARDGPSTGRENTKRVATAEGTGVVEGRPPAAHVEESGAAFRAAMERMMRLEADAVFRTIVEFL